MGLPDISCQAGPWFGLARRYLRFISTSDNDDDDGKQIAIKKKALSKNEKSWDMLYLPPPLLSAVEIEEKCSFISRFMGVNTKNTLSKKL